MSGYLDGFALPKQSHTFCIVFSALELSELGVQVPFFGADLFGYVYRNFDIQVTKNGWVFVVRHSQTAHPKRGVILCAGRDAHYFVAMEGRDVDFAAQHGREQVNMLSAAQVVARAGVSWVRIYTDSHEQVAGFAAISTGLAFAAQPELLPFAHAFFQVEPVLLCAEAEHSGAAVHGFFERYVDIGLQVIAVNGSEIALARAASKFAAAKLPPEKLPQEFFHTVVVFKIGSIERKIGSSATRTARPPTTSRATVMLALLHILPVFAKFVVSRPFFRIAEHVMGFVDFFEFFLCVLVPFGFVRVVLFSQFPKGFFDFLCRGTFGDAKNFVIIFVCHVHRYFGYKNNEN